MIEKTKVAIKYTNIETFSPIPSFNLSKSLEMGNKMRLITENYA